MNQPFHTYHINLDALSRTQLQHAKQTVIEVTGAKCSNGELVRFGLDLVSKELNREMNKPNGLTDRLKRKVGKYRWARSANNTQRK